MLRKVCGTKTPAVAYALASQLGSLLVWNRPDPKRGLDVLTTPAALLAEFSPQTGVQALLAVQMIGVHEAATAFLRRAQPDKDTGDEADKNVNRAVEPIKQEWVADSDIQQGKLVWIGHDGRARLTL